MDSKDFASDKVFIHSIGFKPSSVIQGGVANDSGFGFVPYFKWTFNVLYYLCLVPFRPGKLSPSNDKPLEENIIQKTICAILHLVCLIYWISQVTSDISKPFPKDPLNFFDITINLSYFVIVLTFITTVWVSKKPICKFLQSTPPPFSLTSKSCIFFGFIFICNMAIELVYVAASCGPWLLYQSTKYSPWAFLAQQQLPRWHYKYNASHYFFPNSTTNQDDIISNLRLLSAFEKTLIGIGVISAHIAGIMKTFADIIMTFTVFAVWEVLTKRAQIMKETRTLDNNIFVDLFLDTESLINKINDLFGSLTLAIYTFNVAFQSSTIGLIGAGTLPDFWVKAWLCLSFVYPITTMSIACVVYNKGCDFRALLLSKTSKPQDKPKNSIEDSFIDLDQINAANTPRQEDLSQSFMAYLEMSQGSLGVRGGEFFTYTFAFLGTTLSFCLTVILLMIQLKPSPTGNSTTPTAPT